MNRRITACIIGLLAIAIVSGCAERQAPTISPISPLPTPKIAAHRYKQIMPNAYGGFKPSRPVAPSGPGLAGCPYDDEFLQETPVNWCYFWSDCRDLYYCTPMVRQPITRDAIERHMASCGPYTCSAIMVMNEPEHQESCDALCQIEAYKQAAAIARAINPNVLIIVGNWAYHNSINGFIETWNDTESVPLQEWAQENNIAVGVHLYLWNQTQEEWRIQVLSTRAIIVEHFGADMIVTEWGSLYADYPRWTEHIEANAAWLTENSLAHAPFSYGADEGIWGCCDMRNTQSRDGFSDLGRAYIHALQ